MKAVVTLEPLLKEADDYYDQENYKDDRMAKGKALHPRLVAAWDAFAAADQTLRTGLDVLQDKRALERLADRQLVATTPHFSLYAVDAGFDVVNNYLCRPSPTTSRQIRQSGTASVQFRSTCRRAPAASAPSSASATTPAASTA